MLAMQLASLVIAVMMRHYLKTQWWPTYRVGLVSMEQHANLPSQCANPYTSCQTCCQTEPSTFLGSYTAAVAPLLQLIILACYLLPCNLPPMMIQAGQDRLCSLDHACLASVLEDTTSVNDWPGLQSRAAYQEVC
jgi:hypothetical protein